MDLRSGKTIWRLRRGPPDVYPPLTSDLECEIAIIGGGITGGLIGYELTKYGVECALIDKAEIGGGSTSASTALLSYELDTLLCELAREIGEDDAAACYKACLDSIEKIGHVVEESEIECDFTRRRSLYLAESEDDVSGLECEHAARRKHGMAIDLLRRGEIEELFSFSGAAALLTRDAAEIDVVRFVEGLIKAAATRGLRAFGMTRMASHQSSVSGCSLVTDTGCRITARRVVFATGYESEKYLGQKIGKLRSTFAIASHPIANFSGWHERCLIWTTDRPYLYLRTTADDRAIVGGEDVDFHDEARRDALLPAKTAKLAQRFRRMFPQIAFDLACAWAGTFGETKDSLAYIGEPPVRPGCYFALGYGGNGIAYSMIAAEIIRDAWLGRANPTARLFRFDR